LQFLDVRTDYAFKKVFASDRSKPVLISFLNSIIDFEDGSYVTDLTIVDPYQIPMLKGMKDTFVDVKANLSNNTRVIIEMQVLNVEGFEKRVLYNAAKSYSSQLKKAEAFKTLEPVIALTITDFEMFNDEKMKDKVISFFKLIEKELFINYSNDVELIFIELPKFNKDETQLKSISDKWIYFIKNSGSLEYIPDTLKSDHEIIEAFETANTAGMTENELELQNKRHEFIWMQKSAKEKAMKEGIEKGHKEGVEIGRKEGIEEGIKEGKREAAKKMKKDGLSNEMISKYTGLSQTEVEKL